VGEIERKLGGSHKVPKLELLRQSVTFLAIRHAEVSGINRGWLRYTPKSHWIPTSVPNLSPHFFNRPLGSDDVRETTFGEVGPSSSISAAPGHGPADPQGSARLRGGAYGRGVRWGGPCGLAGAIELARLVSKDNEGGGRLGDIEIGVLEKASQLGEHSLSGAVVNPIALLELFPELEIGDLPLRSGVGKDAAVPPYGEEGAPDAHATHHEEPR
jgi:hypothetical protein